MSPKSASVPSTPDAAQFRVLRFAGERKGFRLEAVFWEAIEVIARRRGCSLVDIVEEGLRSSEAANQSSALRARVAAELLAYWSMAEAKAQRISWAPVLDAIPHPTFAVTSEGQLLACNRPMRLMLGFNETPAEDESLDISRTVLAEALQPDRRGYVLCLVKFRSGDRRSVQRVRLVSAAARTATHPVLLGFSEAN